MPHAPGHQLARSLWPGSLKISVCWKSRIVRRWPREKLLQGRVFTVVFPPGLPRLMSGDGPISPSFFRYLIL